MNSSVRYLTDRLDHLYRSFHHRCYVHPDPLEFLYHFDNLRDREIAALIASSLAYGRVSQILNSVSVVLKRIGPSPSFFLLDSTLEGLLSIFSDFRHRFTTGENISSLLWGARCAIKKYGSLLDCFLDGFSDRDDTVLPALSTFVGVLDVKHDGLWHGLLPSPNRGSACKRLNLFMRWMMRQDNVDPGGWSMVPKSKLIIPLDTHMHRIGLLLNLTNRKQADLRTALEMTDAFRMLVPEDPVRYDFVLTRLGIRKDMDQGAFFESCIAEQVVT